MQIIAQTREQLGKRAKRVREEQKIPAVVFGPDIDSISLSIDYKAFVDTYLDAGETSLLDLVIDAQKEPVKVLISDVQLNPVNYKILHVGFFKVNLTERTEVDIPVEIQGDDSIPLVKIGEALVLTQLSEVTVSALPSDLPKEFIVDVSGLAEIGDSIKIGDLEYDREKVEVVGYEEDDVVAILDYATIEEEEEEEALTEEELIAGMTATEEREETEEEGEEAVSEETPTEEKTPAE